ncbi:hypothetical protein [Paenibacillus planticolens]|uniref:Uncharacterized protein n=1 Tax=Paenibacillus planticolens TaxID=2654976 RepID=A0ABX1ZRF9_9BACL|nr:hypothetical protein [Paenibacillus planticolens]NOV01640.1 hypothetical protein [Paenibacillus planticolens]
MGYSAGCDDSGVGCGATTARDSGATTARVATRDTGVGYGTGYRRGQAVAAVLFRVESKEVATSSS